MFVAKIKAVGGCTMTLPHCPDTMRPVRECSHCDLEHDGPTRPPRRSFTSVLDHTRWAMANWLLWLAERMAP